MRLGGKILARRAFFSGRIYWLFLAVAFSCVCAIGSYSQEIGSYRTVISGDFGNISIWEIYDGTAWSTATVKPTQLNDIYIDQTHTLRLTGNEAVKSVYINAQLDAAEKLNLNGLNLDVYGSLNAFSGLAPGIPANAWNSINWIGNSQTSTLTFKGDSRVLIEKNSWSGQTQRSRFTVIFDADIGQTFTLEAPFKALSFTVRSGILLQKLDTSILPNACNTLSFNTETTVFGTGPFGNFTIETGATLISECDANILNRSTSGMISALNFDLQDGGTLILEGTTPRIEAANFQLNGKVIFRGGISAKTYLGNSYADSSAPTFVRDLEIQGMQNLTLPDQLTLLGDLQKSGTGNFIATNSTLTWTGSDDQEIIGFPMEVRDLILDKSGGSLLPNSDLAIQRNLTLVQGNMDLGGNNLSFNTGTMGELSYSGGTWRNIGLLNYFGIPSMLNGTNSTFPFEDTQNGGIRKVQLLGPTSRGNLTVSFTEHQGAEYNSEFDDLDGTEILYRLFSYFRFSNLNSSPDSVELRISADRLIVDNVADLRIVGTGYAAPGKHLSGLDPTELWARRKMPLAHLAGTNFTVGSFRTLSVLPLKWLEISSKLTHRGILISWKVAQAKEGFVYEIYRNSDPLNKEWERVGEVRPIGDSDQNQSFEFLDVLNDKLQENFYRVRHVDLLGYESWSEVTKSEKVIAPTHGSLIVYPNPYSFGSLQLHFPADFDTSSALVIIQDSQGKIRYHDLYADTDLAPLFQNLPPGLFHLSVISAHGMLTGRLIRK